MPSCLLKFIDPCWDTGNPPSGYLPGTVVAGTPPFAMAIPVVSAAQPDYREVRFCLTGAVRNDTNRVETSVSMVPGGAGTRHVRVCLASKSGPSGNRRGNINEIMQLAEDGIRKTR